MAEVGRSLGGGMLLVVLLVRAGLKGARRL